MQCFFTEIKFKGLGGMWVEGWKSITVEDSYCSNGDIFMLLALWSSGYFYAVVGALRIITASYVTRRAFVTMAENKE